MSRQYKVAVVGATGAVGQEMLATLHQRNFPVSEVVALASERSAGKTVNYGNRAIEVQTLRPESFKGLDMAIFSAGGSVSKEYAPIAGQQGVWVVDNSSQWRMFEDVPLVVPEINPEDIAMGLKPGPHQRIIANPNCSTIQMVLALKPIHDAKRIQRIVVSTYQSVAGAGQRGIDELSAQAVAMFNAKPAEAKKFPYPIAFNILPHIDVFMEDGYTKEEWKMMVETRKILHAPQMRVTATTVRVPVFCSHSESVNIEMEKPCTPDEARALMAAFPGVEVVDDPASLKYPMPLDATGKDAVYVGRVRQDTTVPNGLNLWVVSDNLRKGAALNAVQIAEVLVREAGRYLN